MKVFLSSTFKDLRDARSSLIERLEHICENRITLVCYERDGRRNAKLPPEETCLSLVQDCQAFIILLDKYYGTSCKAADGISITHAELREAFKCNLFIIPVVRTQTWHEYLVWRKNIQSQISYANVEEPRLFEILHEIYPRCNCQTYENLAGDETISEISATLNLLILEGAVGVVQHTALPVEEPAPYKVFKSMFAPTTTLPIEIPNFADGQVLRADDLNSLYQSTAEIARTKGLHLNPAITWTSGQTLKAAQLNALLGDVARIYTHCDLPIPVWSFGQFQERHVLRSSQLNEISESLRALSRT